MINPTLALLPVVGAAAAAAVAPSASVRSEHGRSRREASDAKAQKRTKRKAKLQEQCDSFYKKLEGKGVSTRGKDAVLKLLAENGETVSKQKLPKACVAIQWRRVEEGGRWNGDFTARATIFNPKSALSLLITAAPASKEKHLQMSTERYQLEKQAGSSWIVKSEKVTENLQVTTSTFSLFLSSLFSSIQSGKDSAASLISKHGDFFLNQGKLDGVCSSKAECGGISLEGAESKTIFLGFKLRNRAPVTGSPASKSVRI